MSGTKKIYGLNLNLALCLNGFDISYLNDTRVFGRYLENYVFIRILEKYGKVEYYRIGNRELDFVAENAAFEIKSEIDTDADKYKKLALELKKKFYFAVREYRQAPSWRMKRTRIKADQLKRNPQRFD